jgi:predicted metal-binding membrane protein
MDASSGRDTAKLIALFCVAALAWEWLLAGGGVGMHEMDMGGGNVMMMRPEWTLGYAALVLAMWVVMMVAMMLPSAAPAILAVERAAPFAAGYLAVWSAFGLAATLAQFALERSDLLSDAMALRSDALAGGVVLAVGVYQLSPWKQAYLRACTPAAGAAERDAGVWQAARLGLRYGAYCLGCCWALMVLLFAAGMMNLLWVAAIALWVAAEKLLPWGGRIARVAGVGLVAGGGVELALAVL